MKRGLRILAVALPLAALLAGGSVFLRQRGTVARLSAAGWSETMRRDVTVNGIPGELRVLAYPGESAEEGRRALFPNAPDGTAFAPIGDREWGLWVPGPQASAALVFSSSEAPSKGAPVWPFPDLADPGVGPMGFSAVDAQGRTACCIGDSSLAPLDAAQALFGSLDAQGWICATPGARSVTTALFAKGRAMVVASASERADGSTAWLLLRREAP